MPNVLASHISGQIARTNPLEGGPVADAQLSHEGIISDTWGGYASRLTEHHAGDFSTTEVLGMLGLEAHHLQTPDVQFENPHQYYAYMSDKRRQLEDEAKREYQPEIKRLQTIFLAIKEGFKIEDQDEADAEAAELTEYLQEAEAAFMNEALGIDEFETLNLAYEIDSLKHSALRSGYIVSLAELASVMLGANVVSSEDAPSELGSSWIAALQDWVYETSRESPHIQQARAEDIFIGEEGLNQIYTSLSWQGPAITRYANERLDLIRPAFETTSFKEHPLIHGTEK